MKLLTLAAGLIVFAAMTVPAQAGGRRYYNDNYGCQQQRYNQCAPVYYRPVQYCPPQRYYYSRPAAVNVRIALPIPFLNFGGGRCN